MVTGLEDLRLRPVGGATEAVAVDVVDRGRSGFTPLSDASFGTVRALGLLAMLYDPAPRCSRASRRSTTASTPTSSIAWSSCSGARRAGRSS